MSIRLLLTAFTFAAASLITCSQVSAQLTLVVNRDNNSVSLTNTTATPIDIDEYRIESAAGSLDSSNARWNSLEDLTFGFGPWFEVGSTSNNLLAELNETSTTTVTAAGGAEPSISIGTPFAPNPAEFGIETEDLQFTYSGPAGIETGEVSYVGERVFNSLVLDIDRTSGAVSITNESVFDVDLVSYQIESPSMALDSSWAGLGGTFDQIGVPNNQLLAELDFGFPDFGLSINAGQSFSIGNAYSAGAAVDAELSFTFGLVGDLDSRTGGVKFQGGPGGGSDADNDGDVDGRDFLLLQQNNPAGIAGWVADYPSPLSGVGAVASVPEPSAVLLFVAAGVSVPMFRRR